MFQLKLKKITLKDSVPYEATDQTNKNIFIQFKLAFYTWAPNKRQKRSVLIELQPLAQPNAKFRWVDNRLIRFVIKIQKKNSGGSKSPSELTGRDPKSKFWSPRP